MGIYIQEVDWGVYLGINPVLWGKKGSRIRQREMLGCGAVTTKAYRLIPLGALALGWRFRLVPAWQGAEPLYLTSTRPWMWLTLGESGLSVTHQPPTYPATGEINASALEEFQPAQHDTHSPASSHEHSPMCAVSTPPNSSTRHAYHPHSRS